MAVTNGCKVKGLLKTFFDTKGKPNQISSVPVIAAAMDAGMTATQLGLETDQVDLINAWRVVKNKAAISLDVTHEARVGIIKNIGAHFGYPVPDTFK